MVNQDPPDNQVFGRNSNYSLDFVARSQEIYGRKDTGEVKTELDQAYWNISSVLEQVLAVAEKYKIVVWAEYGTLLGLKRDSGVILWDYDADLGILHNDKDLLLNALKKEQEAGRHTSLVADENYYKDVGCMAFYIQGQENEICDLIYYVNEHGLVRSLQTQTILDEYPCAYNYQMEAEHVFPLKPETLLGHRVYVWNNWELPLRLTYGDWRTPIKDINSYIIPKFHGPAVVPLPIFHDINTFEQFWELRSKMDIPFVCRQTALLHSTEKEYAEARERQDRKVFGYESSLTWEKIFYPVQEVWEALQNGSLKMNMVDSPVDFPEKVVSKEWLATVKREMGDDYDDGGLCWIMTNTPCITQWHTDPRYITPGKHEGDPGGYMKLLKGRKTWWFLPRIHLEYLKAQGHAHDSLLTLTLSQMLKLENGYAFGKIIVGEIEDGDLIWFPPDTMHKVITHEVSWGWGGYI